MNKCKNCSELTNNPLFCGKSCSATYNNKNVVRNNYKPCAGCGEKVKKLTKYSKFCSLKCKEQERVERLDSLTKICNSCKEEKTKNNFHNNESEADGKMRQCKLCNSTRVLVHYSTSAKKPQYVKHGLTEKQFEELKEKQNNSCAICKKDDMILFVDHDHTCCNSDYSCGTCVRGLLCSLCNAALGMFRDSPTLLDRAKDYLIQ